MRDHAFFAHDGVIQEEAARLLADVYALYEFDTYEIFEDERDTFYELHSYIAERTERSLLTLAGLARVNDDGGAGLKHHKGKRPDGVGLLIEGTEKTPLSAREACNKIIHARAAKFRLDRLESHPIYQNHLDKDFPDLKRTYLRPQLLLAGERVNGEKWEATLDLVQWVHAVLHFSTLYAKKPPNPPHNNGRAKKRRAS